MNKLFKKYKKNNKKEFKKLNKIEKVSLKIIHTQSLSIIDLRHEKSFSIKVLMKLI